MFRFKSNYNGEMRIKKLLRDVVYFIFIVNKTIIHIILYIYIYITVYFYVKKCFKSLIFNPFIIGFKNASEFVNTINCFC